MATKEFHLVSETVRGNCLRTICEAAIIKEKPVSVKIGTATRSSMQNRKLHAMLGDLLSQFDFRGYMPDRKQPTIDDLKHLFVSAHKVATNEAAGIVRGFEGELVSLYESTSKMSVGRLASLIEYINAWAAKNDIVWTYHEQEGFYG